MLFPLVLLLPFTLAHPSPAPANMCSLNLVLTSTASVSTYNTFAPSTYTTPVLSLQLELKDPQGKKMSKPKWSNGAPVSWKQELKQDFAVLNDVLGDGELRIELKGTCFPCPLTLSI
jgi:hypothetical protein